jgi:hypothetical protein
MLVYQRVIGGISPFLVVKSFGFGKRDLSEDITNTTLVIENPVKARVVCWGCL